MHLDWLYTVTLCQASGSQQCCSNVPLYCDMRPDLASVSNILCKLARAKSARSRCSLGA